MFTITYLIFWLQSKQERDGILFLSQAQTNILDIALKLEKPDFLVELTKFYCYRVESYDSLQ